MLWVIVAILLGAIDTLGIMGMDLRNPYVRGVLIAISGINLLIGLLVGSLWSLDD